MNSIKIKNDWKKFKWRFIYSKKKKYRLLKALDEPHYSEVYKTIVEKGIPRHKNGKLE